MLMFEVFKRFGKFIKYGLQSVVAIVAIITLCVDMSGEVAALALFGGLLVIGIVEGLARAVVWIVSGYEAKEGILKMIKNSLISNSDATGEEAKDALEKRVYHTDRYANAMQLLIGS